MKTELTYCFFTGCGFMHLRQLENSNMNEYCLWQTSFRQEHMFLYDPESARFILYVKHEKVCDCHINTKSQFAQLVKIFWNLHLTINPMKSPEQKITDLEKRQEEITKEITELKKELKPKERTLQEIVMKWAGTDEGTVMCKHSRADKLYAIRDIIAVADELNGDWEPDFIYNGRKYCIFINDLNKVQTTGIIGSYCICYFASEELAQKAITILGEEKIKLALS